MSLLFSLLLSVSAMFTVDNINFTIADNEATVTFSPEAKGDVTIPATIRYNGVTCPVVAIADSAFFDQYQITSVSLPRSIRSIGGFAFFNTSIRTPIFTKTIFAYLPYDYIGEYELPKTITEITAGAFYACGDLTSVVLPKKLDKIGGYAFYASGLTSPVMSNSCFAYLPEGYKGSFSIPFGITTITAGACDGCEYLTRVTIPSSVSSIGEGAFRMCFSLDSVVLPVSVNTIKPHTFDGCKRLIHVSLPPVLFKIEEYAFSNCSWLSRIDFSKSQIKSIGDYAFYGCVVLQTANFHEGLLRIGNRAFDQCNELKEVYIPKSLAHVGEQPFEHTKVNKPLFSRTVFIRLPESYVGTYAIPDGITEISSFAFSFCQKLENVVLPASVNSIGKLAFQYSGIRSISVPDGATVDETAFKGCKYLNK